MRQDSYIFLRGFLCIILFKTALPTFLVVVLMAGTIIMIVSFSQICSKGAKEGFFYPKAVGDNCVGTFLGPAHHRRIERARCRGLSGMFIAARQATSTPQKMRKNAQKSTR